MFQAGIVAPSSPLLLQLLTLPEDVFAPLTPFEELVSDNLDGLPCPPIACDAEYEGVELASLVLLIPLGRPYRAPPAETPPVLCGLTTPLLLLSPMVLENLLGCTACALLLKADIHCSTCAGSLDS